MRLRPMAIPLLWRRTTLAGALVVAVGATPLAADTPAPPLVAFEQFLKFQATMESQADKHRVFVERFSIIGGGVAAFLLAGFGGVITWMGYRSRKDIRQEVNEQLAREVRSQLADASRLAQDELRAATAVQLKEEVNRYVTELKLSIKDQVAAIQGQIDDLKVELDAKAREAADEISRRLDELSVRTNAASQVLFEQAPASGAATASSSDGQAGDAAMTRVGANALSGLRILWVDDYPGNNDGPAAVLRALDVQITTSLDTEDALGLLDKTPRAFDLILSDMGRKSSPQAGVILIQRMRATGHSHPVIIYCSNRAAREFGKDALQAGASAVVGGGPAELFSAIRSMLMERPGPAAAT